MPQTSLTEYLDKHGVRYSVVTHSPAFTAQGVAALSHTPGKNLAKSVVVKLDGKMALVVLPASFQIDLDLLRKATKATLVELASEREFKDRFPECETGAMPPFGNLYGLDVIADEMLANDTEIAFNACSHRDLIRLPWRDFERLAEPKLARFAAKRTAAA